jgi:hypothetical protein
VESFLLQDMRTAAITPCPLALLAASIQSILLGPQTPFCSILFYLSFLFFVSHGFPPFCADDICGNTRVGGLVGGCARTPLSNCVFACVGWHAAFVSEQYGNWDEHFEAEENRMNNGKARHFFCGGPIQNTENPTIFPFYPYVPPPDSAILVTKNCRWACIDARRV